MLIFSLADICIFPPSDFLDVASRFPGGAELIAIQQAAPLHSPAAERWAQFAWAIHRVLVLRPSLLNLLRGDKKWVRFNT